MRSLVRLQSFPPRLLAVILSCFLPGMCQAWQTESPSTAVSVTESPKVSAEADTFFESKIRPILVQHCLECHSGSDAEANLALDSKEGLQRGGDVGEVVSLSEPSTSRLLAAVRYDGELQMPPSGKLNDEQISALEQWADLGFPWPDQSKLRIEHGPMTVTDEDRKHWAFQPITNPPLPSVQNTAWPRTSIDAFVLSELEKHGLNPSPSASRETIIRRLYHRLIGLPPTYETIQAFRTDPDSDVVAIEKVVDHLLQSPRYGERWARHWLDVARYADTKDGVLMYDFDRIRPYAYTYRDYVIRAFNDDLPYDDFVRDQLAADLVSPAVAPWRLAAVGFLTLGRNFDSNRPDIIDDQIDTISRGLFGLTVSCARCHDHKYDPIPTADYYSLYGVLASCETPLVLPLIDAPESVAGAVEFENQIAPKRAELIKMLDDQYELLTKTARERLGDYFERVATTPPDPAETSIYYLVYEPHELRHQIVHRLRKKIQQTSIEDPVFGLWHELLERPTASAGDASAPFAAALDSAINRWLSKPAGIDPGQANQLVLSAILEQKPADHSSLAKAYGNAILKIAQSEGSASDTAETIAMREAARNLVFGRSSPLYFPKSETKYYMSRTERDGFEAKIVEIDRTTAQSASFAPRAMVITDSESSYDARIFTRGNPQQPGDRVPRRYLAILSPNERPTFSGISGRLDLANSIASRSNPLTARVLVNRVWMHHFGEPLVSTPSDFGRRSTPPRNLALLDHLAHRFMEEGWSIKKLHRWIVLSATFAQSSSMRSPTATDPAVANAQQIDPDNRLLWRMNRQRLDLESMRDSLLQNSGRIEHQLGGRPVDVANEPSQRRRTIYGLIDRQSVPGMFRAFDFASPDMSNERRSRTMVPQQALFAMNSPIMIEQAKSLANREEVKSATTDADKVTMLVRLAWQRDPSERERELLTQFLSKPTEDNDSLNRLEQLAQILLSSNELMYVD